MTPLIELRRVTKLYPSSHGFFRDASFVHAVEDVSLVITEGDTLSLVGESGSGKTTTTRLILGLEEPTSGKVLYRGQAITAGRNGKRRTGHVQAVFQDPYSSLNPRMNASTIVSEPLVLQKRMARHEALERADQLLRSVGLDGEAGKRYPHQFSGGQRQRIAIARALALDPEAIILDEPVSSLDVSIQAQILNLLRDLQDQHNLTYVLVAHNLATVRFMSTRVAVMYLGKIVEVGDSETVFCDPRHPYTKALLSATLSVDTAAERREIVLSGEMPSPENPPSGCRFRTRCPFAAEICAVEEPQLMETSGDRRVACHFQESLASSPLGRVTT